MKILRPVKVKGGMVTGPDGRVHCLYSHNPSTLRLASQQPNMQNLPRPDQKDKDALPNLIRNLIVPAPGWILGARDFCVAPRTKVLKANLIWEEARDLKVGDELIGFDEKFSVEKGIGKGHKSKNKFRHTTITGIKIVTLPLVKVYTNKGITKVAANHKFVARKPKYKREWVEARNLKPGMLMPFLSSPWETEVSKDSGWIAGILDGEGWCSGIVGFAQNKGLVLDKMSCLLKERGFHFRTSTGSNSTAQVEVLGGFGEQLRLLGSLRPIRLLPKAPSIWEGKSIAGKSMEPAVVLAIEPVAETDENKAIAITTTTGTYISDGFFSHNCGIEAVLVGYEARDKDYIRLAWRDVHSFYTAWALYEIEKRIPYDDLPQLSWDDDRLFTRLAEIKSEFKKDRNNLYKHLIHAINFGQGAYGARDKIYEETNIVYDVKLISKLMGIYKTLFPKIPEWQTATRDEAADKGFLQNAFNYVHRFNHVYKWEKDRYGEWERKNGDDAEAVLAFRPQSNAAGILKEAMLRLYFERFEEAGQYMRLTTHDELLWECPPELQDSVDAVFVEEMEKVIPQMPMPAEWGMGTHLKVLTEGKMGSRWGLME